MIALEERFRVEAHVKNAAPQRRGPRRRQVLPPSAPSQPIHTKTWQIAQLDSTKMSAYHRRPQRKRKTPSCGTH
ncbi:hypothetical protein CK203_062124 [Vitis vinifera]|uniref:Uncharacterized protein n=1 Tax=Vitis vinifera TaxID=29760 RepID=A0A438FQX7_VITVI|nr:hypothetical protein CK203_062124 [Vitis vinifera]